MSKIRNALLGGAAVVGVAAGSFGIASAGTTPAQDDGPGEANDTDVALRGSALDQAVEAALAHTGDGVVTETELGDDGAAYGVEVRLPDGTQIEVNLDAAFSVISASPDDD